MYIFRTISEYKNFFNNNELFNKKIGFVPTMGALHEGHLSLLEKSKSENDISILSIFVNPIQFGENEDFAKYPKTFEVDILLAEKAGVDIIFAPNNDEIYPEKQTVFVDVLDFIAGLCSLKRPCHFRGVSTVVSKLFNIISPTVAYFGQKDYQQFLVIKKMVEQLNFNIKISMCDIVRESDGLAMSSRNKYLSIEERKDAVCLSKALNIAKQMIKDENILDTFKIKKNMQIVIESYFVAKIEYIFIGDANTLNEVEVLDNYKDESRNILIALAVYIGKTRLIDNILV